jgi:nitrite reductase (NADH) large subunit
VPRVGLERIREAVLGEESGAALRERFGLAKAAVRDPWLEREDPYHPRQFADLDDDEAALVGPPVGAGRG